MLLLFGFGLYAYIYIHIATPPNHIFECNITEPQPLLIQYKVLLVYYLHFTYPNNF